MNAVAKSEADQAMQWSGRRGCAWVEAQELLDRLFQPFEDLLVETVASNGGKSVLDIGCGTGSTTLAIARRIGSHGHGVGVDISEPMIAAARLRAEREQLPAAFVCADAQKHAFEAKSYDAIVSRFGVMFFDDPVRAFANLRGAARDGAVLQCLVWRSPEDNPFMTVAERAAAPLLPNLPVRKPGERGQFGFADARRVRGILEQSGWSQIDIRPIDIECTFAERALVQYLTKLGPVGVALQQVDEATRTRVIATVRAAFEPYVRGPEVRFNAACWSIGARAAS